VNALAPLPKVQPAPYISEKYVPYRVLWVKVIIRAAYDYALWKESKDFKQRKYAMDAERWFFSESSLMNGFVKICEVLKLDPALIRRCVRKLTREQVKKLEFKEREGKDLVASIVFGHLESGDDGDDQ
jgi:hypothetical protein